MTKLDFSSASAGKSSTLTPVWMKNWTTLTSWQSARFVGINWWWSSLRRLGVRDPGSSVKQQSAGFTAGTERPLMLTESPARTDAVIHPFFTSTHPCSHRGGSSILLRRRTHPHLKEGPCRSPPSLLAKKASQLKHVWLHFEAAYSDHTFLNVKHFNSEIIPTVQRCNVWRLKAFLVFPTWNQTV